LLPWVPRFAVPGLLAFLVTNPGRDPGCGGDHDRSTATTKRYREKAAVDPLKFVGQMTATFRITWYGDSVVAEITPCPRRLPH